MALASSRTAVHPHGSQCLVLDAAFTKPFGIILLPRPRRRRALYRIHISRWKAREYNFQTRHRTRRVRPTAKMPEFVVEKAARCSTELKASQRLEDPPRQDGLANRRLPPDRAGDLPAAILEAGANNIPTLGPLSSRDGVKTTNLELADRSGGRRPGDNRYPPRRCRLPSSRGSRSGDTRHA